jgi:hypothetical protein
MNHSKYNIEIDLSFLEHDYWDIDDAINYFIAYSEFHRGHVTGAFAEIINRYANVYPKEIFSLFCRDIFNEDETAVEIIHSLYGGRPRNTFKC